MERVCEKNKYKYFIKVCFYLASQLFGVFKLPGVHVYKRLCRVKLYHLIRASREARGKRCILVGKSTTCKYASNCSFLFIYLLYTAKKPSEILKTLWSSQCKSIMTVFLLSLSIEHDNRPLMHH